MTEAFIKSDDLMLALAQRDALARACERALIDLRAAKLLAQHTLGEPHGINQTIEIIEFALEGHNASKNYLSLVHEAGTN